MIMSLIMIQRVSLKFLNRESRQVNVVGIAGQR